MTHPERVPPTPETWTGAWNNWIAPFHACPRCCASLNWKQGEDVFDRPMISASCCGLSFAASLTWEIAARTDASRAGVVVDPVSEANEVVVHPSSCSDHSNSDRLASLTPEPT